MIHAGSLLWHLWLRELGCREGKLLGAILDLLEGAEHVELLPLEPGTGLLRGDLEEMERGAGTLCNY